MAVREWTPQQRAFMEWLCTPGDEHMGQGKGLRLFKTRTALAAHLGVHLDTLKEWERIPGFDQAMSVVAGRTFRKYEPTMVRTLIAQLHKPEATGYDRLVTAWVRYLSPAMNSQEEQERWDRLLPEAVSEATNSKDILPRLLERAEQLPVEQHRQLLMLIRDVTLETNSDILTEVKTFQVGRMTSEAEEEQERKENESSIIDIEMPENYEYSHSIPGARVLSSKYIHEQPPVTEDKEPRPKSLPPQSNPKLIRKRRR